MKYLFLITTVAFISTKASSQNIGIGTNSPNPAAKLEISSNSSGLLVPRMTAAQRDAISNPPKGLILFVQTDSSFNFYDGAWKRVLPSGEAWLLKGNAGTDTAVHFIGTLDNMPLSFRVNNNKAGVIDPGSFNTGLGLNVLTAYTVQGTRNTAFGAYALSSVTSGTNNTGIGYHALSGNLTGDENTALGMNALNSNTIGGANVAVGINTLYNNVSGSGNTALGNRSLMNNNGGSNTGVGSFTLTSNVSGGNNTAVGNGALYSNNASNNTAVGKSSMSNNGTGSDNAAFGINALSSNYSGNFNAAVGDQALQANISGNKNVAVGSSSLFSNTAGTYNSAFGAEALYSSLTANFNTAAGYQSLYANLDGFENAAFGQSSLRMNTSGTFNTAVGSNAMYNNLGGAQNTAVGTNALQNNTSGNNNIAIGFNAGNNLTTGQYNIDIGNGGVAAESGTIRIGSNSQLKTFIAGIYGQTPAGAAVPLYIDANGQVGTNPSSGRFKEHVQDIGNTSDCIYHLRPVSFRYKGDAQTIDKSLQYGLIAEEVEQVNTDLVAYGADGKIFTVKYQLLVPLLLNELKKEHAINKEQANQIRKMQLKLKQLARN